MENKILELTFHFYRGTKFNHRCTKNSFTSRTLHLLMNTSLPFSPSFPVREIRNDVPCQVASGQALEISEVEPFIEMILYAFSRISFLFQFRVKRTATMSIKSDSRKRNCKAKVQDNNI